MCGLECDVCKQKLPLAENTTPTICIFPCFHKYCERCKAQVLASARPQHGAESRVSCKLCNQHFLLNVLYDYSENQIEKIFCLHCNIKNKAPVEWRCKSCENRYLCAHCSQPHYHSGHELEPVMKPSIPLRSQCTSHSNVLATYLCSCQARLCDYCLNNHADGSTEHPHEQRIAYTKLAERARTELETIRRQSIRDTEKIESLKEKVATNKKQIGIQATQARTAVANEVVELVNAIIRRGNDIVTCIDSTEETKIKNCGQLEKEMQHWLDRLTKIESFTQSALFTTVQQDHPGMWSASMFSQSALFQVNKRRDLAKNTLEQFERSPIISYQSWSTKELFSAIRSFGLLNLDGEIKIPAQSTPQNAHMFSISNSFTQSNSNSNTSNNATDTPPVQQQQNKRPIPPTQNVPPIIRSTSNHSNASTSQQHAVNFSGSNSNIQQQQPLQQQPQRISTPSAVIMTLSSPPPNIQQNPPSIHHPIPQQQHNIGGPNLHHSEIHHISVSSPTPIIPQLLQQPLNVSGSRFVQQHPQQHPQQQPQQQQPPQHHPQRLPQLLPLNCPLPVVGSPPISLPNTPLTPVMHGPPDQMQIMRQNIVLQQQQHIGQQQLQQQPHQQQQRSIQQQQPCLPHRQPPPPQFRMQQIPQNHAGPMPHQIQQQNICQNSQQSMFNQQQPHQQPPPHIIQQQQMQQHQHYMTAQRLHLQQQQLMLSQQALKKIFF
ncbi:unnamed protein product [Meloidogyne enterolobii]|uniref:Uncharacterized protein n=2 Tax=Meloidogyne enterolobii TaxID=390850 RepID=A0ACB0XXA1_MELEN